MSCLGQNYNPNPTRTWSRFENTCIFATGEGYNPNDLIYIPMLKRFVYAYQLDYELAVLQKGNILQYKKNSSNITKNQKYAQIARGYWTNRTTTWASQTESYTNPNTNMLIRSNYTNITIDGVPTLEPITRCPPVPTNSFAALPSQIGFSGSNSGSSASASSSFVIPPPPPPPPLPDTINNNNNNNNNGVLPPRSDIIPTVVIPVLIIPDGGTLQCNSYQNICSGETYVKPNPRQCNPTSASDVPGPIKYLCYDDSLPTYYPRERRTYTSNNDHYNDGLYIADKTPITVSDVENDITDLKDINLISLVNDINGLIILFLDKKYAELDAIFTPEYLQTISVKIYDLSVKYKIQANYMAIIQFTSHTVQLLYKSSTQSIENLQLKSDLEAATAESERLLGILQDPTKLTAYLAALHHIGLFETQHFNISTTLDINPIDIIYLQVFGAPGQGYSYDLEKEGNITSATKKYPSYPNLSDNDIDDLINQLKFEYNILS